MAQTLGNADGQVRGRHAQLRGEPARCVLVARRCRGLVPLTHRRGQATRCGEVFPYGEGSVSDPLRGRLRASRSLSTVTRQLLATGEFGPPKSERSERTIALDLTTVEALKGHREAQKVERVLAGDAYQDQDLVTVLFGPDNRAAGILDGSEQLG